MKTPEKVKNTSSESQISTAKVSHKMPVPVVNGQQNQKHFDSNTPDIITNSSGELIPRKFVSKKQNYVYDQDKSQYVLNNDANKMIKVSKRQNYTRIPNL